MIKKTLFILVVVVVAAVVGALSVEGYHKYKNQHRPVATVTVAQKNAAVAQAQKDVQTSAAGEYSSLKATALAECLKGSNAYAALTPALKAKTAAPNCALLQN